MAPRAPRGSQEQRQRAQALGELLRVEHRALLRQAHRHSRDGADAEDALGDACVAFLRFYAGPGGSDALRWMLLVVKRCAWAIGRRARARESREARGRGGVALDLEAILATEHLGPAELAERAEQTARAIGAIDRLKPDEREALLLLGLGCTHAEIRALRGWSYAKLHRCLGEGRAKVRELLERGASL
jgi:DNA-directed RNA polymerase specialized sigma24 family protein